LPRGATGVRVPAKVECDIKEFYQQAPAGQPLALFGSTGFLEIALNSGHAAQSFSLKIGDPVVVK
jgi:S-adenosylmethionine hydrolase